MRLAVLVSGSGTILRAMFEAGLPVTVVLADRPCAALTLAGTAVPGRAGRPGGLRGLRPGFDREGFTADGRGDAGGPPGRSGGDGRLRHRADRGRPPGLSGRILNTHPALLPAFPGWHGVRDALAAGVSETGCTVHLATLEMDAGPILAQEAVPVLAGDTEETLHERIKVVERRLYPATVAWALDELEAGRAIHPDAREERGQA